MYIRAQHNTDQSEVCKDSWDNDRLVFPKVVPKRRKMTLPKRRKVEACLARVQAHLRPLRPADVVACRIATDSVVPSKFRALHRRKLECANDHDFETCIMFGRSLYPGSCQCKLVARAIRTP